MRSLLLVALAFLLTVQTAQGQDFKPNRPVTLIVPYSAGGGTDVVGRLFAKHLGELWGQPVIVDNRTGANGVIGSAIVAKAPPDGHTLLLAVASIAINPHVLAKLPYDTRTAFTPITPLAGPVVVMVGSPKLKADDVRSFVELAKREPGVLTFASSEPSTRLYGERLAESAGIKLVHVPYKGAAQWMTDVMSGNVDVGFASITSALASMKDGRMKTLAVASARRSELLPEVRTFREQGILDLDSRSWYGLFGPGHLPPAVVNAIYSDVTRVLARSDVRAALAAQGAEPGGEPPADFQLRFHTALKEYGELVRKLNIRVE